MIAYFYTNITNTERMLIESKSIAEELFGKKPNETALILSPVSTYLGPLDEDVREMSILSPLPDEALEGAVICGPVRYFCDAYGAAFLTHIHNAISKDGLMAVPFYPENKAKITGFWSLCWLEEILGKPLELLNNNQIALFRRGTTRIAPQSILSFFMREGYAYALDFYKDKSFAATESYIKSCKNFIVPPMIPLIEEKAVADSRVDLRKELNLFFSNMNYSVTGASYKVAGLRRIIERYLSGQEELQVVDIGGGAGFVGVELLLTCSKVFRLVNCEPMVSNLPLARRLYSWFKHQLKDRYKVSPLKVEEYPFDKPVDMIYAFASLLYSPRQHLEDILKQAWDSLRPGGIFVIHENIKREFFAAKEYYNQMFSVEELEKYLSPFGRIDYYRSSDIQPMSKENTRDLTVFRVIQKGLKT